MKNTYLFNSEIFLQHQITGERHFFQQANSSDSSKIQALFHLFVQNQIGFSPFKAPFGSIEFTDDLSEAELNSFIESITLKAIDLGLKEIIITSYPNCYEPIKSKKLTEAFVQNGFKKLWNDLNFHLPVDDLLFIHKIHPGERWKLRQSHKAGFRASIWQNPDLNEVYNLILESRFRKGFPLSLCKEEFMTMFERLPESYQVFGVWSDEKLAAVAVTVSISVHICYTFYTADRLEFRRLSPVVMLHECMYNFCIQHQFTMLDLGTASKNGLINQGVANFKRRLGGIESFKTTFTKLPGV